MPPIFFFGSFGSLLLKFVLLGRVYQFVAMPLGLDTGRGEFTALVKEVRKLALRLGISVDMFSSEPIVVEELILQTILELPLNLILL